MKQFVIEAEFSGKLNRISIKNSIGDVVFTSKVAGEEGSINFKSCVDLKDMIEVSENIREAAKLISE